MRDLYTLGNFTIDDIILYDGRTWIGQPGGNAVYSAIGARIWLDNTGLIARAGTDLPPDYLETLQAWDIEMVMQRVERPNLHNWALYEADGHRQFIYHRTSGTFDDMCIRPEEIPDTHRRARAYHIASMPTPRQQALLEALHGNSALLSLDPHEHFIEGYEETILAMLPRLDFFLPSREEARLLYGRDTPEEAARDFGRHGSCVAVVKLGDQGSLLYDPGTDRLTHVPVYPASVVDVTGAGDAYCGGFLAAFLLHGDPLEAACYGTVSASYVIEHIGAALLRRPARAEASERLATLREQLSVVNDNSTPISG
jgi:sugar/nucleoside kinase (ribokinase family)